MFRRGFFRGGILSGDDNFLLTVDGPLSDYSGSTRFLVLRCVFCGGLVVAAQERGFGAPRCFL